MNRGIAPIHLELFTSRRRVVSFTSLPLYPWRKRLRCPLSEIQIHKLHVGFVMLRLCGRNFLRICKLYRERLRTKSRYLQDTVPIIPLWICCEYTHTHTQSSLSDFLFRGGILIFWCVKVHSFEKGRGEFRASEDKDTHFSHIAKRIQCERDERNMAVTIQMYDAICSTRTCLFIWHSDVSHKWLILVPWIRLKYVWVWSR